MSEETIDQGYPRTPHMREFGKKLFEVARSLGATRIVLEDKLDAANSGLQFDRNANIMPRSRGHFLNGGFREGQFDLFRKWADWLAESLFEKIEDRYIVYGEWMAARHSIFYDQLPHLFHEFDILDIATGKFFSTARRREILGDLPILPVPVLYDGPAHRDFDPRDFITRSDYQSENWEAALRKAAEYAGLDPDRAVEEGDRSGLMEGIYIKFETDEHTVGRAKYVRPDFTQVILEGGVHWADRPMIRNQLAVPEAHLFMTAEEIEWAKSLGQP